MIYLDNAATTRIHQEVIDEMNRVLVEIYGNPNSLYYEQAVRARAIVEKARSEVASLVNVNPSGVIFTSGATEGNNMVLKGVLERTGKTHIITTEVEHSSVLETCNYLSRKGIRVSYLKVDKNGAINLDALESEITEDTALVSIMWANNETGIVNNIKTISEICERKKVLFHTDATQAIGKVLIDLSVLSKVDFITFSAHKFYGPKGVGAVIINHFNPLDMRIEPLIHGGDQENKLRGGTLPTHQIAGIGTAARICKGNLAKNIEILKLLEIQLIEKLRKTYGGNIEILNEHVLKVPGIVSVRFKGINNQVLLKSISDSICASSGSACSNSKPSHVYSAMGYELDSIKEIIRISLSPYDDYNKFDDFE